MDNNIYIISVHSDNDSNIYKCIVRDKPTKKDLQKLEKKIKKGEDLNCNCYAEIEFECRAEQLISIQDVLKDYLENRTAFEIFKDKQKEAANG